MGVNHWWACLVSAFHAHWSHAPWLGCSNRNKYVRWVSENGECFTNFKILPYKVYCLSAVKLQSTVVSQTNISTQSTETCVACCGFRQFNHIKQHWVTSGPRLNIKTVFPRYGICMLKIRGSRDIFILRRPPGHKSGKPILLFTDDLIRWNSVVRLSHGLSI